MASRLKGVDNTGRGSAGAVKATVGRNLVPKSALAGVVQGIFWLFGLLSTFGTRPKMLIKKRGAHSANKI